MVNFLTCQRQLHLIVLNFSFLIVDLSYICFEFSIALTDFCIEVIVDLTSNQRVDFCL